MSVAALLARLVLAGVFAISGWAKVRDRDGAAQAARDLGVPAAVAGPVGTALPFAELAVAAALLLGGPPGFAGGLVATVLLLAFTALIATNLLHGRHPACHCFGEASAKPLTWAAVARNAALLVPALLVTAAGPSQPYGLGALRDRTATELAVGVTLVALVAVVAALVAFGLLLLRRYGALLLRVEELEARARGEDVRPVAPEFVLRDLRDEDVRVTLTDLLYGGRPALLVFASATCEPCAELAPAISEWAVHAEAAVAVLSSGDPAVSAAKFAGSEALRVLGDDDDVAKRYGATRTPAAVLVSPDARISGGPAFGADAISALVAPLLPHVHHIGNRPLVEGDPAPALTLRTEHGQVVDPARLEDEAVLLFWDPACGFAQGILAEVVAWESAGAETPLVLVSMGDPAEVRESGLRSPIVLDPAFTAGTAFGAPGTPSAVAVRQGLIASEVAVGGPEVLDLLDRARTRSWAGG